MRVALIYNRNQRVGIGERCEAVLRRSTRFCVEQFDLRETGSLPGGFDLYLRLDDGDYDAPFPAWFHPYIWWVADTHIGHAFRKIVKNASACDHLFCFQKEGAERVARAAGRAVHWLPAAADHVDPLPPFVPFRERKWDVAFVGTTGKFSLRKVTLEFVQSGYPNSFIGVAPYQDLFAIYSQARIVVNYPIDNDINMRMMEAAAAGALVLSRRVVNNGFEELFQAGEDCDVFDDVTTSELKDKIDHYLAHLDEAEGIARNGFERVNNRHTYKQRLERIFEQVGLSVDL